MSQSINYCQPYLFSVIDHTPCITIENLFFFCYTQYANIKVFRSCIVFFIYILTIREYKMVPHPSIEYKSK